MAYFHYKYITVAVPACKGERITLRHWPPLLAVIEGTRKVWTSLSSSLYSFFTQLFHHFYMYIPVQHHEGVQGMKVWKCAACPSPYSYDYALLLLSQWASDLQSSLVWGLFGAAVNTFTFRPGWMTLGMNKLFSSLTRPLRFAQSVRHTWCLLWASHYATLGCCVCVCSMSTLHLLLA